MDEVVIRDDPSSQPTRLMPKTYIEGDTFRLRNPYRVKRGACADGPRYIVSVDITDLYSGLGVLLLVLAPCWKYALETGRTLVIDWRGNPYTRENPETNLFPLLFKPPDPSAIGVPCIVDDSINHLPLPQPILGPAEALNHESGVPDQFPLDGLHKKEMRKIFRECLDVDAPTLIPSLTTTFQLATRRAPLKALRPPLYSFEEARRLYRNLELLPQWAALLSEFYEAHMADRPVIGVHVRHGNGEGKNRAHFKHREIPDPAAFLDSLTDKIRRYASGRFGNNYTVFLCTDSADVVDAMEPRFPSFVTRRSWRPPSGDGMDFDFAYKRAGGGLKSAVDALIDMRLLAKCDAVLLSRPTNYASHVPYIMNKPGAVFLDHNDTAEI